MIIPLTSPSKGAAPDAAFTDHIVAPVRTGSCMKLSFDREKLPCPVINVSFHLTIMTLSSSAFTCYFCTSVSCTCAHVRGVVYAVLDAFRPYSATMTDQGHQHRWRGCSRSVREPTYGAVRATHQNAYRRARQLRRTCRQLYKTSSRYHCGAATTKVGSPMGFIALEVFHVVCVGMCSHHT